MADQNNLLKEFNDSFKPGIVIMHGDTSHGRPYWLKNTIGATCALIITTIIIGCAENLWNDGTASPKLIQNFLSEFIGCYFLANFLPFARRNEIEPGALAGVGLYASLRGMDALGLMTPQATQ